MISEKLRTKRQHRKNRRREHKHYPMQSDAGLKTHGGKIEKDQPNDATIRRRRFGRKRIIDNGGRRKSN